ncbi:MAG TPA: hypothetical protein VE175_00090 [Woeseiaceae bacterium]|jgi:hypothetical protein|nr:hypothetical protein [Woeseiaceae bacterium]
MRGLPVLSLTLISLTACAILGGGVRERSEEAFRRQNQLSSRFMLEGPEIEAGSPAVFARLAREERSMLRACEALNTVAAKRSEGEDVSLGEKRAVLRNLDECEKESAIFAESLERATSTR